MSSRVRRSAVPFIAFIVTNLLLATPAVAGLTDAVCTDDLGAFPCCRTCWILCSCSL
jgi:hypothetical protein